MIETELEALGFAPWAKIELKQDRLRFSYKARPADRREGFVYAWVWTDRDDRATEICYVGKAGGTLAARAGQHRGGFTGQGRGGALATLIRPCLVDGEMRVWVRHSPEEEVLGQRVSRCAIEEQALIGRLKPSWNKLLPRGRSAA